MDVALNLRVTLTMFVVYVLAEIVVHGKSDVGPRMIDIICDLSGTFWSLGDSSAAAECWIPTLASSAATNRTAHSTLKLNSGTAACLLDEQLMGALPGRKTRPPANNYPAYVAQLKSVRLQACNVRRPVEVLCRLDVLELA